ncbi:MAG: hypothetical protein ACE5E4_04060 [Candidatus Binatia bacterium]
MRKLAVAATVALAAALGFALSTLVTVVNRNFDVFAEAASEYRGVSVSSSGVGFSFSPLPAVELRDLKISRSRAGKIDELATIRALRVRPRLGLLFTGRVEIASVEAIAPVLHLLRYEDGSTILDWGHRAPQDGDGLGAFEYLAGLNAVTDGRVLLEDRTFDPPAFLELKNAQLSLEAEDQGLAFSLRATLYGDDSPLSVAGSVRPGVGPSGGHFLRLEFSLPSAPMDRLREGIPEGLPRWLSGRLALAGTGEGFVGETSTEDLPAEGFDLRLSGSCGISAFEREESAELDLSLSIDDRRLRVMSGRLGWRGMKTQVSGWTELRKDGVVGFRASLADLDLTTLMRSVGLDGAWLPRGTVSGLIRVSGTRANPLIRYQASVPALTMKLGDDLEVSAGRTDAMGALLAINTDVSASISAQDFQLGAVFLPEIRLGLNWWRGKLTLSALDLSLWGGRATLTGAYVPSEEGSLEFGGILDDVAFEQVVEAVSQGAGLGGEGGLDAIFAVHGRGPATTVSGRVGLHRGRILGFDLLAEVTRSVSQAVGVATLTVGDGDELADESPFTAFESLHADFRFDGQGLVVSPLRASLGEARLRGSAGFGEGGLSLEADLRIDRDAVDRALGAFAPIARLRDSDGSLNVPIRVRGPLAGLGAAPVDRFLEALKEPLAGPVGEAEYAEPLDLDLPPLLEQFGR